jgi:uncharacterized LabA/DUF88 family protein
VEIDCQCPKVHFNAYIDGFNLYKGVLERRPHLKWLDLISFCRSQKPEQCLRSIYYFTAPVKERFHGDDAPRRQEKYLRVLTNQKIQVIRGKFRKDSKWLRLASILRKGAIEPQLLSWFGATQHALTFSARKVAPDMPKANVYAMEEKGSDVNLASYLLRDCYRSGVTSALIITGDSDLVTPIRFATEFGVDTKVIVPNRRQPCEDLRGAARQLVQLHPAILEDHQLPKTYISSKGRQVVRPAKWS